MFTIFMVDNNFQKVLTVNTNTKGPFRIYDLGVDVLTRMAPKNVGWIRKCNDKHDI